MVHTHAHASAHTHTLSHTHTHHYEEREAREDVHEEVQNGRFLIMNTANVGVYKLPGFQHRVSDCAYLHTEDARASTREREMSERARAHKRMTNRPILISEFLY